MSPLGAPREPLLLIYATAIIALMLTVVPLPSYAAVFRPVFLAIVILYWSTMTPQAGGILLGFLFGLLLDAVKGVQLGQHALAMSFLAYLAIRLHLMTRAKPLFQQCLFVAIAMVLYETLLWAIDGWSGRPMHSPTRWAHAITDAMLWPVVAGLLGRTHGSR
ncbi:MAG: rod shape-determining protein MreD [Steroidobacteraceae bacterium]